MLLRSSIVFVAVALGYCLHGGDGQYDSCEGDWSLTGDGVCTAENNNAACGYDGGDCCLCSCSGAACLLSVFDCLDPSGGDELFECQEPPPAALPCSADAQQMWLVENSAQARALAAAVNCSGGSFEVEWRGNVAMEHPIYVADGTVLTVRGTDASAVVDGNAATRLFTVVDAVLHLDDVNITSGASVVGGAIAAARAVLTFNRTNFIGNSATGQGGAVYVSDGSSVSCSGGGTFTDNTANIDGGAMFVSGRSVVSCGGSWFNNAAGYAGGALRVQSSSSASWGEDATFASNTAGRLGGGLSVYNSSSVSWTAPTSFISNFAETFGGGLYVQQDSNTSWSGVTTFTNNVAGDSGFGGGLYVNDRSSASWSASTTFSGNKAGSEGGAVIIVQDSLLSWSGASNVFEGNQAGVSGGAVMVSASSNVSSAAGATSLFFNNSATFGGAVLADSGCDVFFDGSVSFDNNTAFEYLAHDDPEDEPTTGYGGALLLNGASAALRGRVQFFGNSAASRGGGVDAEYSNLSWDGDSILGFNTAAAEGGALYALASSVSWAGEMEVANNSARRGGGVFLSQSTLSFDGDTSFVNNAALFWTTSGNDAFEYGGGGSICAQRGSHISWGPFGTTMFVASVAGLTGGALLVSDSRASWSSPTKFIANSAVTGGAIGILNGSEISWTGDNEFALNEATGGDGGAIFSPPFDEIYNLNPLDSTLNISGSTDFANNTSVANGGALSLLGACAVTVNTAALTFFGNTADIAGGAVFLSGTGVGPTFSDVRFESNSAQTGGAVSASGTGTARDGLGFPLPTTFDGCHFIDNRATATGGAVESAAGHDKFIRVVFESNKGATGGALRLAGTASMDNCSFLENVSDDAEGAAVSNIGVISIMSVLSFTRNLFSCRSDLFLDYPTVSSVLYIIDFSHRDATTASFAIWVALRVG